MNIGGLDMEITALANLTNETIKIANKFIPNDLAERMANRMSDAERASTIGPEAAKVIGELMNVPGITPASSRDLKDSVNLFKLKDGTIVSRYVNPVGCEHVFLSNEKRECVFGGWVGWIHNKGLKSALERLRNLYAVYV